MSNINFIEPGADVTITGRYVGLCNRRPYTYCLIENDRGYTAVEFYHWFRDAFRNMRVKPGDIVELSVRVHDGRRTYTLLPCAAKAK